MDLGEKSVHMCLEALGVHWLSMHYIETLEILLSLDDDPEFQQRLTNAVGSHNIKDRRSISATFQSEGENSR